MLKEVLIGVAGLGVGYLVARNQLEKKYAHLLDLEIQRTKEFFGATYEGSKEGLDDQEFMDSAIRTAEALTEYSGGEVRVTPSVLAQELEKAVTADTITVEAEKVVAQAKLEAVEKLTNPVVKQKLTEGLFGSQKNRPIPYNRIASESEVEEKAKDIESNVAATPLDPDARNPYQISFAEFDANETSAEQITVSFFAGDGIVIDEEDNVVSPERVEQIIGTDNLNKFGTMTEDPSMDPNVIYIRCERFGMDFEVTRSPGKHAVEVLGEAE